jgi:hypothetical protein
VKDRSATTGSSRIRARSRGFDRDFNQIVSDGLMMMPQSPKASIRFRRLLSAGSG